MVWTWMLWTSFATEPVAISEQTWQEGRWVVAAVDLNQARVELVGQHPDVPKPATLDGAVDGVRSRGRVPLFATNAGIFARGARPLGLHVEDHQVYGCLLYTSPSPRDATLSRMPSSA